jgi:hypothetical protein
MERTATTTFGREFDLRLWDRQRFGVNRAFAFFRSDFAR